MGNYKEDTCQSSRIIFFIILLSLLVLASPDNSDSYTSSLTKYHSQNELVFADISNHIDAVITNIVRLPVLQKYCGYGLHNSNLNPLSIQNKNSDYNRRIAQNLILNQKIRLSIEPVLPWQLYFHLPSGEDDSLPVLS